MSDRKNIDRLFQEKFKDFEVTPENHVWENIESRVQKKKSRRMIPLWWSIAGAAAVIAILLMVGNGIFSSKDSNTINPLVKEFNNNSSPKSNSNDSKKMESHESENTNDAITYDSNTGILSEPETTNNINSIKKSEVKLKHRSKSSYDQNMSQEDAVVKADKQKSFDGDTSSNQSATKNAVNFAQETKSLDSKENEMKPNLNDRIKSSSEISKILKDKNIKESSVATEASKESPMSKTEEGATLINEPKELKPQDKDSSKPTNEQTIEEAIAEANDINEKEEEKLNRWSIAPNVAPVYFSSLGDGSAIGSQFNTNSTSNTINMSYGVKGSYAIGKRLKVKAGVNRVNLNNITNDIIALSDQSIIARASSNSSLSNINLNNPGNGTLMVMSKSSLSDQSVPESIKTLPTGDLEQRFGFIEVPIELEYRLVDKKIGVNVIGGMSTLFLNNNEVFANVDGENTLIGSSNNLNNTSFSANFGIGLDYGLTDKMNINLEPMFKYQINTFRNTSGDFQPFFIGVYTGLSFKF